MNPIIKKRLLQRLNLTTRGRYLDHLRRNVYVARGTFIAEDTTIGDHTNINTPSYLGACSIGRYCAIAGRLIVRSTNHEIRFANMQDSLQHEIGASQSVTGLSRGKVSIGDACWIGDSVIVIPGAAIGKGAVIGAGSVVTRPIPDFAIAAGVPARVQRMRFDAATIEFLLGVAWWEWDLERIRRNRHLFEIDFQSLASSDLQKVEIFE